MRWVRVILEYLLVGYLIFTFDSSWVHYQMASLSSFRGNIYPVEDTESQNCFRDKDKIV